MSEIAQGSLEESRRSQGKGDDQQEEGEEEADIGSDGTDEIYEGQDSEDSKI